jgi:hypothetical protein
VQKHLIHTEYSDGPIELRYLVHIDKRLAAAFILDPSRYQIKKEYTRLFTKGTLIRSTALTNRGWHSMASMMAPAVPRGKTSQPFIPFVGWDFTARESQWSEEDQTLSTPQKLIGLYGKSLERVNPQAAPRVVEWATSLEPFEAGPASEAGFSTSSDIREMDQTSQHSEKTEDTSGMNMLSAGMQSLNTTAYTSEGTTEPIMDAHSFPLIDLGETVKETVGGANTIASDPVKEITPTADFDRDLFGDMFAPELVSDNAQKEAQDLLSTSPEQLYTFTYNTLQPDGGQVPRQCDWPIDQSGGSLSTKQLPEREPRVLDGEQQTRQYFNTMNQQGGRSHKTKASTAQNWGQSITGLIKSKFYDDVSRMLQPLRFYLGQVTLKVEVGRLWFTKIG